MANRNFDDIRTLGKGRVVISGSFAPNGSSALVATSTFGTGFTVAYTSTGLYTITLSDSYRRLIASTLALQLASGDDKALQWGAIDVSSAKTLQIRCWDTSGGAVADIAANANNRIHFTLILQNSSVGA